MPKTNLRPISVLPVVPRLFKKLVHNKLRQYLNINGLLSSRESELRALHSTITALLKCTNVCYSGLDLGNCVGDLLGKSL